MRSFASAIDEPTLFQISDELPNFTGHTDNITEVKTSKQRGASVNLGAEAEALDQRRRVNPPPAYSLTASTCLSSTCLN